MCPTIFDSWSCYNESQSGSTMKELCPHKPQLNFDTKKYSSKICRDDGTWWIHPSSNRTWSNYSSCLDHADFDFRKSSNIKWIPKFNILQFSSKTLFYNQKQMNETKTWYNSLFLKRKSYFRKKKPLGNILISF